MRELAGCKRVLTAGGEREDDAMQQEASILLELEAVEQDAEDLRELVADLLSRQQRETAAAAAKAVAAAGAGEAGTGGGAGKLGTDIRLDPYRLSPNIRRIFAEYAIRRLSPI